MVGKTVVELQPELPDAGLRGVGAGGERGARRRTERLIGDALAIAHAAIGQSIDVRRAHGGILMVGADEIRAKLVRANHQDVWLAALGVCSFLSGMRRRLRPRRPRRLKPAQHCAKMRGA